MDSFARRHSADGPALAGGGKRSRIAEEREDILQLIRQLERTRSAPARPADDHIDPHELRLRMIAGDRASQKPSNSEVSIAEVVHLVQTLESRLERMEETLRQLVDRAPSGRAPASPSRSTDHTFAGVLRESLMSETLQLVSRNTMTGIFTVEAELGSYDLFIREGEIHHGEGPGVSGEAAVFAAISVQDGRFWFRETPIPDKRTVQGNTQFLILEALRRIDEQQS